MIPAVTELYGVFKPYRLGEDFAGCSCCVPSRHSELLASTPLAELNVASLNNFAFKAMTTWGSVRDFKHFLPRLLELTLDDYLSFDFPEALLGKLSYAKWSTWPAVERDAVQAFLNALWKHHLSLPGDFPIDDRIRRALGGLAEACETLKPFLDEWADTETECSALHLAQLIDASADEIVAKGRIRLWGKPSPTCDEVILWMRADGPENLLLMFRDAVIEVFPLVFSQLEGIRAATLSD
jgi:hypothetical protein